MPIRQAQQRPYERSFDNGADEETVHVRDPCARHLMMLMRRDDQSDQDVGIKKNRVTRRPANLPPQRTKIDVLVGLYLGHADARKGNIDRPQWVIGLATAAAERHLFPAVKRKGGPLGNDTEADNSSEFSGSRSIRARRQALGRWVFIDHGPFPRARPRALRRPLAPQL